MLNVHLPEVKNNGKFLKVVAYGRWLFTGGVRLREVPTINSELTGEVLAFWKSGRLREVVRQGHSTAWFF